MGYRDSSAGKFSEANESMSGDEKAAIAETAATAKQLLFKSDGKLKGPNHFGIALHDANAVAPANQRSGVQRAGGKPFL
jgi:hypothetical protein